MATSALSRLDFRVVALIVERLSQSFPEVVGTTALRSTPSSWDNCSTLRQGAMDFFAEPSAGFRERT